MYAHVMQYKAKGGGRRSFSHFSGSFKRSDAAIYNTSKGALIGEVKRRRLQLNKTKEPNCNIRLERSPKYVSIIVHDAIMDETR